MIRSQTKIRKMIQANILLEKRFLAKEDYDTLEPEIDDTPIEDESPLLGDEEDDVEDFGFDVEDGDEDYDDLESFDREMRIKDMMRKNKLGSIGVGSGSRWDKESEKEFNPIKADDLPLDKFLKSKYNKK